VENRTGRQTKRLIRRQTPSKLLASTGYDNTLRLWSTKDWSEVRRVTLKASGVFQLPFAPDGEEVTAGADRLIQRFAAKDGKLVDRVAISPDGRFLANAADGKVRVWERG
jgi:WD40 repeat protein